VIGNLISNTMIVVLSLSLSVYTAIASLVFLILIHKLELLHSTPRSSAPRSRPGPGRS